MTSPIQLGLDSLVALGNAFVQPIFVQILGLALQALPLTLTLWTQGDRSQDENELRNPLKSDVYDFIVVGAGSSGCLLANRLSRKYNVLLLEAGGEINPIQFIPTFAQFLLNYPEVDYGYRTVSQRYASQNTVNKQTSLSAGKGLGGSGTLNILIHLRGHVKDFNRWAQITGDPQWSFDGVLPYFKSYEDYEIPGDEVFHGYNGELRIEAPDYIGTAREFVAAGAELGYPNVDLNGAPYAEGFDVIRYPIRNGIRQATYKAFLEPILTRLTLTIMKYAQVIKILMKPGNVAYGIQYDRHGNRYTAYASKEVIISAGAIGTPKLLLLSGIGPREDLQKLGIPLNTDLPVGRNLKDHISILLGPFFLQEPRSINLDRDITPTEFVRWFTKGRGPLTTSTAEATGVFSSSFAKLRGEGDWPDLQIMLSCFTINRGAIPILAHAFSLRLDAVTRYYTPAIGRDSCFAVVVGSRPFSKGYMKLGGSSPYDEPIIDPNYFGDEDNIDFKVIVEGVKHAVFLMENTTAFGQRLGVRFTETHLPGCEHLEMRTDAYWECFARGWSISVYHPSGTAAMGSVVDSDLRVYNVRNLRAVDNSIAPEHISVNPQASVMMIAEKISYTILNEWSGVNPQNQRQQLVLPEWGTLPSKFLSSNDIQRKQRRRRRGRNNVTETDYNIYPPRELYHYNLL